MTTKQEENTLLPFFIIIIIFYLFILQNFVIVKHDLQQCKGKFQILSYLLPGKYYTLYVLPWYNDFIFKNPVQMSYCPSLCYSRINNRN